jgi:hypothetical protein
MPDPTEILKQTGPQIEPTIPAPVGEAGITPINEAQSLSDVHAKLANLQVQSVGGPHTIPETNHEATTTTVKPITMPAPEEPVDKTTTPWWKNILHTRQREQQEEQGGIKNAA